MPSPQSKAGKSEVYRIPPIHYVHIRDENTNVTRTVVGPLTYVLKDHESCVIFSKNIIIPPRHYALIANPVVIDEKTNEIVYDSDGAATLRHGEREIRLSQEPFPLQPGEQLVGKVNALKMLMKNEALRLRALESFDDKRAGMEWLFEGPGLYIPNVNVEECGIVKAKVVRENQALQLMAIQDTTDRNGVKRVAGEEWLIKRPGPYLPGVFEQVVQMVNAITLTDKIGVHMRALSEFTDAFGTKRSAGEQWLITKDDTESYIPSVNETKVKEIPITILSSREYCVILNPYDESRHCNVLGAKRVVTGPCSFFLRPNERLGNGVEKVYILDAEDGLIVRVEEEYGDKRPGDRFLVRGPCEYVPPVEVIIESKRRSLALASDEGVYVRDLKSGEVRAVIGETLMLSENEERWSKECPQAIEELLDGRSTFGSQRARAKARDKTKVISYRVPHGSAVQVYDYKKREPRVVFGPKLVMLQPNEMFTPLSLSGGKPKKPNMIRALHLLLGPDFSTDIITVETSDHARLDLRVSYNWHFDLSRFSTAKEATALFSVADFVGDMCNAMASRIRGTIASKSFDEFHRTNATIIRNAIFGSKGSSEFVFPANGLVINGIDIQSIEPVDAKTRQALQRAVQLAIQITTDSQEQSARQEAERMEQEASGKLQREVIKDNCDCEKSRKGYKELVAQTKAVETAGQAKAEAQSLAEAQLIQARAAVEEARLLSEAKEISQMAAIAGSTRREEAQLSFLREKNAIEEMHQAKMADIQTNKFGAMIKAIGPETIGYLALAKSTNQVAMLKGLDVNATLITDGKSPINLLATATSLVQTGDDDYGAAGAYDFDEDEDDEEE